MEQQPQEKRTREKILEVRNLSVSFKQYEKGLRQKQIQPIKDLSLDIYQGEIVAVVGASGSGKSLLAHGILGILPVNASLSGEMFFRGEKMNQKRQEQWRGKEITLIPQSVNYLDPLMRVGKQVQNTVATKDGKKIQEDLFRRFHLPEEAAKKYPFQLSGGMIRRVLISTAISGGAKLIIADEPTPGLHPAALGKVLKHLKQLAQEGSGILFITHDLMAARSISDRIVVFYGGATVEVARVADFTGEGELLRHPYTKALWNALPQNKFEALFGTQSTLQDFLPGCPFAPRCGVKDSHCQKEPPELRELRDGKVRCFYAT